MVRVSQDSHGWKAETFKREEEVLNEVVGPIQEESGFQGSLWGSED